MSAAVATTATSLEAQVLQTATRLQVAELAFNAANPDTPVNNITITSDAEGQTVTIAVTLPVLIGDTNGMLTATPTEYLP